MSNGKEELNKAPAPKSGEEKTPLPSIEEAGKLTLSLFKGMSLWGLPSDAVQQLLKEKVLSSSIGLTKYSTGKLEISGDHYSWLLVDFMRSPLAGEIAGTRKSTTNTPAISKENVDGAEKIITVTIDHHWRRGEPTEDLVLAYNENQPVRAYGYQKGSKLTKGEFQRINSLAEVGELVNHQPEDQWDRGARISLWEAQGDFYSLEAEFKSCGVSFRQLLSRIQEIQQAEPLVVQPQ